MEAEAEDEAEGMREAEADEEEEGPSESMEDGAPGMWAEKGERIVSWIGTILRVSAEQRKFEVVRDQTGFGPGLGPLSDIS